jgi:hypothetical protein
MCTQAPGKIKATKPSGNNDGVDVFVGPNDTFWGCAGCNGSGLTNSGSYTTRDNVSGYAKLETRGLTGKYTQDLGGPTLTVIGDYSKQSKRYQEDSDASPYTLFQFFNGSDVNQESLEARLWRRHQAELDRGSLWSAHRRQILRRLERPGIFHRSGVQQRIQPERRLRSRCVAVR